ncbi:MAG TPA: hypothetical protein VHF25_07280 [Nitriliruptorales bacterium]|nr:hypothetical protein [Nitriliruptorales bacterium]
MLHPVIAEAIARDRLQELRREAETARKRRLASAAMSRRARSWSRRVLVAAGVWLVRRGNPQLVVSRPSPLPAEVSPRSTWTFPVTGHGC